MFTDDCEGASIVMVKARENRLFVEADGLVYLRLKGLLDALPCWVSFMEWEVKEDTGVSVFKWRFPIIKKLGTDRFFPPR